MNLIDFACVQVGIGGSENFYSVFESELADHIPVVHASIGGCRIVGRLCVGEKSIPSLSICGSVESQVLAFVLDNIKLQLLCYCQ